MVMKKKPTMTARNQRMCCWFLLSWALSLCEVNGFVLRTVTNKSLSCSIEVNGEKPFCQRVGHLRRHHHHNYLSSTTELRSTRSTSASKSLTTSPMTNTINMDVLRELDNCKTGTAARRVLQQALPSGNDDNDGPPRRHLFGSVTIPPGASDRVISDGDLAIQTRIRNSKYGIFDLIDLSGNRDADRASASVLAVFVASSLSAIAADENLPGPEILRFVVVWILSFAPLALVGYGTATPDKLQAFLVTVQRNIFPVYRKRMIQHEAGHFLMAHLLGFPIQGYSTNAVKNAVEFYPLSDPDVGRERASMLGFDNRQLRQDELSYYDDDDGVYGKDVPFFSKDGKGAGIVENQSVFRNVKNYTDNPFLKLKIDERNEPTKTWPYRGFDYPTVDKLTVVSLAGVCAEILAYGNAEGGIADVSQLNQIFANTEPALSERDRENRIRFAIGFTMTQLRLHLGALDALAGVMDAGGSVSECVAAIEGCSNVSGEDMFGEYDFRRRQQFKSEASGILEKILLGQRNADDEEDRMVEGAGGGFRRDDSWRNYLQLSGDDPFWLAGGIAFLFLAWASSGGLSLH